MHRELDNTAAGTTHICQLCRPGTFQKSGAVWLTFESTYSRSLLSCSHLIAACPWPASVSLQEHPQAVNHAAKAITKTRRDIISQLLQRVWRNSLRVVVLRHLETCSDPSSMTFIAKLHASSRPCEGGCARLQALSNGPLPR